MGLWEKLKAGKDYYEIRLESIGGLGANLCGKMLGELGLLYLKVNSSNFSSYGSEKTGTPVKGFVRYCVPEKEIRIHYPVVEPDILAVFHPALLREESIFKGCHAETAIVVALEKGQENNWNTFCGKGIFYGVEAQKIAMETHSRINVVMLGAILRVMGLESQEAGEKICRDLLGSKYPEALLGNLEGLRRGFEEVHKLDVTSLEKDGDVKPEKKTQENKIKDAAKEGVQTSELGYAAMPIGGVNPYFGNSILSDLSPSRQGYIPVFHKEKCINCGLCFSACPDMVFQFQKGEYNGREMMINQGLDYYHCKGCLRCVKVCPVNALSAELEAEHSDKKYFMPNQELLRRPDYYEKTGANGYVTSESYLTEKRMTGGEV